MSSPCKCGHDEMEHTFTNDDTTVEDCTVEGCECRRFKAGGECAHKWDDFDSEMEGGPTEQCTRCGDVR